MAYFVIDHVHEKFMGHSLVESLVTAMLYNSEEIAHTKLEVLIKKYCKDYAEHSDIDIEHSEDGRVVKITAVNKAAHEAAIDTFHMFGLDKSLFED